MNLIKIDPFVFNNEPDYFPLYEGLKPSSMGLRKITSFSKSKKSEDKVFLIGESFDSFRKSKIQCRNENLEKYYQKIDVPSDIISFMVQELVEEYPDKFKLSKNKFGYSVLECLLTDEILIFNKDFDLISQFCDLDIPYIDAFDALSMQVPEDLVIHKVPKGQFSLNSSSEKAGQSIAIHLCHCNGWDAQWAIGKGFDFIHEQVPRIGKIIPNTIRMLMSFFRGVRFERIAAISFKSSSVLNRHPSDSSIWAKDFDESNPEMFLRVERQTVTGFEKSECFLFTIRTFLYDVDFTKEGAVNTEKRLDSVMKVFSSPDKKSYAYDIINKNKDWVLNWCKTQHKKVNN